MSRTLYFFITENVHLLDLSGMLQVFQESSQYGLEYEIEYLSTQPRVMTSSGLEFSNLKDFQLFLPSENDIVCVPGSKSPVSAGEEFQHFFRWLKTAHERGAKICSICSGAFMLAESGLLDHRSCTTHWALTDQLEKQFPKLLVKKNVLFIADQNIYTSAGFTTGVDLALYLIEEQHGSELAAKLARELVVYIRRDGGEQQLSIYMQFRSHQDEKVHAIQDWIVQNIDKKTSIEALADRVHTSPRNLTRIFKEKTGITLTDYRNKVRLEKAKSLMKNTGYKMDHVAKLCGYTNSRQLRSLLQKNSI